MIELKLHHKSCQNRVLCIVKKRLNSTLVLQAARLTKTGGYNVVLSIASLSWAAEHRAAHDDGELATARAAASTRSLMAVSSSATTALEDVAAAGGPDMMRWFQLSLSSRKVSSHRSRGHVILASTVAMQHNMDAVVA